MQVSPVRLNYFKQNFAANYHKSNNVTILGTSSQVDSDVVLDAMEKSAQVAKQLVLSGKNVVTGCSSKGVMGSAYYAAAKNSTKDEKGIPEQNIVVLKKPLWGDEDLRNCQVFGSENSEAERIERFIDLSDSFVIFPGGPGTMQEAATLISNSYYNKDGCKNIVLVGSKYFEGLDKQYWDMYDKGMLSCPPSELYTICDDVSEIFENIKD